MHEWRNMGLLVLLAAFVGYSSLSGCEAQVSPYLPGAAGSQIMVVYPKQNAVIDSNSTFLIGSCVPGSALSCQGRSIKLNDQGFFAHVVRLKYGINELFVKDAASGDQLTLSVVRPTPQAPIPPTVFTLAKQQIEPNQDMGVTAGDIIPLSIRCTPGALVSAWLGRHKILLKEGIPSRKGVFGSAIVNLGLETAYGQTFQKQAINPVDIYYGFYKVSSGDHWHNLKPRFVITKGKHSLSWIAPCRLTTVDQPLIANTAHEETIVRLAPGQARSTPLPSGVRMLVDGWQGNSARCLLAAGHHVWILKEDLMFEPLSGLLPTSEVATINVRPDPHGIALVVPLSQRLPFEIDQQLIPNRLTLKLFGATSNTDWITTAPATAPNDLLDHVTWKQTHDHIYEITAHLCGSKQWGFQVDYENTNLVLHIKAPPSLSATGAKLAGVTICLDPGHGGNETGAIGPSGINESRINLAIALKLEQLLKNLGATVIMTRQTDDENPSLSNRVHIAVDNNAHLLVSIHNNALPDGRDPWAEHGTSTYWYHVQSIDLAKTIRQCLLNATGLPDFGTNYQNLFLTRPCGLLATLVEVGFMINPDEYAKLIDSEFQLKAAGAIATGIVEYLRPTKDPASR